jgi:hypothetical protein
VVVVACAALTACNFDQDLKKWGPDGGVDSGVDAGHDGGLDAGTDAGIDAGTDGGFDAGWVFAPDGSYNFAFVTSSTVDPSNVTAQQADALCAASARDAGLPGIFGAWFGLSSGGDAYDRIAMRQARGWRRTDGLPFADQTDDLIAGNTLYPLRLDEHGADVLDAPVLSGAGPAGLVTVNCDDWSTAFSMQQPGCPGCAGTDWSSTTKIDCSVQVHVYCFGVDQYVQVSAPPRQGPRVFVSTIWRADGGLAGADEHCNFDAQQIDAGSGYIALLSTTTQSAASRLSSDAGWIRADGVDLGDMRQPLLDAAVFFQLETSGYFATGSSSPMQPSASMADSCNDWTFGLLSQRGLVGSVTRSIDWWEYDTQRCDLLYLLCVQP